MHVILPKHVLRILCGSLGWLRLPKQAYHTNIFVVVLKHLFLLEVLERHLFSLFIVLLMSTLALWWTVL